MAKTIKIKRSGDVFQSEREAIAFLSRTPHQPGQPVLVRYWASETEIDAILAVGTQTGLGPGTYTIVSVGGIRVISGIVSTENELPDSSMLVNGETWLYKEPVTDDLYWIYLYEDTREVTPVNPNINYRVFSLSDNSEYWIYGGSLDKANNYHSQDVIDQRIGEITLDIDQALEGLKGSIATRFRAVSETLGTSLGYTGTVPGATNFDDADRILQSRITQTSQSIQGLSNRISDLEKELTSDTEGLTPTTRLDTLYTWYDSVTHTPTGTIEFLDPVGPLTQGSLVSITAVYRWSWASRGPWSGLRLGNEIKPFGVNDVAGDNIPDGHYEWTTEVHLTDRPITLKASFEGSDLEPVKYVITPDPIERNITISWPTQGWNAGQFTYTVTFEGSGLPASWAGNEISITQANIKVFQATEGQGPIQNTTYTGILNSDASVTASWSSIISTENFQATYLVALSKNSEVTTGTLEASERTWISYQESPFFETPDITYGPDQTLVILSPYEFSEPEILCMSGQSEPLTVTSDFTTPEIIQYHGKTYNYISFPEIGAGTFKFIIT